MPTHTAAKASRPASELRFPDLRARFGAILAVAMAPLLLVSGWQAVLDYRATVAAEREQRATALDISRVKAETIVANAERALALLEERFESEGCEAVNEQIEIGFPEIANIGIIDPEDGVVCSSRLVSQDSKLGVLFEATPPQELLYLATDPADYDDTVSRLILSRRLRTGDPSANSERLGVARIDWAPLWEVYSTLNLEDGARVSVVNGRGQSMFASAPNFATVSGQAMDAARASGAAGIKTSDTRLDLIATDVDDVFIALRSPREGWFAPRRISLVGKTLLPVLAWMFAFGAIWFAADRLILTHMRRLRAAALRFAGGDTDARVGEMRDAPERIAQLGSTFDLMAENIAEREAAMKASLEEKEILLREIHHRVKNNLQIITSLLNMQARETETEDGISAIEDARNRVSAIALVHSALYEGDDLADVRMQPFLEQLVGDLFRSLGGRARGIGLHTDFTEATVEADRAIPIALFVVEALSNAIKHGVPDGGRVHVSYTTDALHASGATGEASGTPGDTRDGPRDGVASPPSGGPSPGVHSALIVRDTGPGPDTDVATSTGLRLMRGFARQLGGRLETRADAKGYEVRLEM